MDIISRIKEFMEYNALSSSQFADAAGIPRPTLSQLLNGRNKSNEGVKKISSDIIRKIHDAYPALNVMWLLFGDGDMMTDDFIEISEPKNDGFQNTEAEYQTDNQSFRSKSLFDEDLPEFSSEKYSTPKTSSSPILNRPTVAVQPDNAKRVQSIMVFYSDNSFEIFKPSE